MLLNALTQSFLDIGLDNYKERLIGFMSDGASVNFGQKAGLLTKLRESEMPWIVGIHCLNHRLELAIKDAFKGTAFDEICTLLSNIHTVYEKKVPNVCVLCVNWVISCMRLLRNLPEQMVQGGYSINCWQQAFC